MQWQRGLCVFDKVWSRPPGPLSYILRLESYRAASAIHHEKVILAAREYSMPESVTRLSINIYFKKSLSVKRTASKSSIEAIEDKFADT